MCPFCSTSFFHVCLYFFHQESGLRNGWLTLFSSSVRVSNERFTSLVSLHNIKVEYPRYSDQICSQEVLQSKEIT